MPAERQFSAPELAQVILAGWQLMVDTVPDGVARNRRMATHYGLSLSDIEHLSNIRNLIAHTRGELPPPKDLLRAVRTVNRLQSPAAQSASRDDNAPVGRREPRPAESIVDHLQSHRLLIWLVGVTLVLFGAAGSPGSLGLGVAVMVLALILMLEVGH